MILFLLVAITLVVYQTDTYAGGAISYAGKSNPYAEYPIGQGPIDDDRPVRTVRRPQPSILVAPQQNPQAQLSALQIQLQQAQQDLNNAQQNNLMEASKIQEKINSLSQQISALQKQMMVR